MDKKQLQLIGELIDAKIIEFASPHRSDTRIVNDLNNELFKTIGEATPEANRISKSRIDDCIETLRHAQCDLIEVDTNPTQGCALTMISQATASIIKVRLQLKTISQNL